MSVAVISACYGDYDYVESAPYQTVDAEWIMVTDNADLNAPGWTVHVEPRNHMHPRLAAKVPKCLPWLYTEAYTTVWVDGSFRFSQSDSLAQIVQAAGNHYLAQIVHPWRDDIAEEAGASLNMPKYEGQDVLGQALHYTALGHPENWGLWATGLIVRNQGIDVDIEAFGNEWLTEQVRWTYQDQISHPYLIRKHGLSVRPLPFDLHGSGVFEWRSHTDGT